MEYQTTNAIVHPSNHLDVLSRVEVSHLLDTSRGGLYQIFRNCSLAVLNCGCQLDDGRELLERYKSFDISILQEEKGVSLYLKNAPSNAFVDGEIIKGIGEHLYAVLRDILYVNNEIANNPKFNLASSEGITDAVFHILRNANTLHSGTEPKLVVCWGGHSISREEYDYSKLVGYELGLRGLDICTGCGPGAMKGPMKGAAVGHAKQRLPGSRYLGLSEPGIIAAESPNPIVSDLVILPDIEKRLEAFVRVSHGVIVFPGGVGTAEEIFYTLGILLHPNNRNMPFPLIFTGPEGSCEYFDKIDAFIAATLGDEVRKYYRIIVNDPQSVGREIQQGVSSVRSYREERNDAFYFNWGLTISPEFQAPFRPTHENMANLQLHNKQQPHMLAANIRNALSGIVAGNVKEEGLRLVEKGGPFQLQGEKNIMQPLAELLHSFEEMHRMKRPDNNYKPCYQIHY